MTKKQKVVFAVVAAVVAAVLVPGIILSYVCYHFIYGTRITSREGEAYHKLEGKGVYSPLAVFPSADMDTVSQDFYYQTRDEIFAATCQIYLENQYTREQYEAETERLRNLEFSYQDQTNMLYQDEENYCSVAYVAMANWTDRYEYAITLDDSNTIIYVYLQNMDAKDIHMQSDYLPKYFQDNNAGKHQDTDPMTSDYRSFYAFRIGDHYIDCMDLADQIVDVLKGLASALEGISDWIKDNQGPFDAIVITIGAFAAVWKAVDLAEFLMNAGGVVGIINKMKAAIHACTLAKIADKFETIQLCAMYAKDFVKSIIQSISKLEIYYTTWFKVNILQSDTVKGIKDLVTNIKASTIALKDDIVEWVRNTAEKTKNKAVDIGGNIKNLAIDMAKATKELALQSIEWVKNTAEKAKNKAVDVTTGIKDFIVNMALATKELVSQAIQWGISTASKVADTAATAAHTAATWLATAATTAFGVAMSVLTSPITLVIVALAALGVAIYELVKHWDVVKDAAGKCWDWITDKWCKAGDWFKGIWQDIKSAFSSFDNWLQNIFNIDFSDSFGFIGNIMNAYLNNVSNIFGDVKQIFGGLIDFIAGVFSGDWSKAWEGIVDAFGGIFSMIADIAKGPINMVIGLINGMLDGLESGINWMVRKVNSLSFDVPDWVPVIGGDHFGFDLPEVGFGNVPYLAEGGYVKPNTPQLAMIGDNRHQGEVVAPEDKLIDMAQKAAAMASSAELLAEAISILKQILKILETLDLDIQLDGKSLKKYVVDKINEHTKQTGKCEIIT